MGVSQRPRSEEQRRDSMKILFVRPNKDSFGYKPISISLLSGIAKSAGWDTRLFDTTEIDFGFTSHVKSGEQAKFFKPVDASRYGLEKRKADLESECTALLDEYKPDCLALSVLSDEHLIAAQISGIAKKVNRDLPVIWGGKYPTLNPDKTLREFFADYVCVGEGIDAFREFLETLSGGRDASSIANIYAKRGGRIVKNPIRPLRKTLDDLPYADWDIFDKRQFYKPFDGTMYIGGDHMLNWGCPYHCTYCINDFYHTLYKKRYSMRRYGIRRIIDELKFLKERYALEFFKFHDEDFLMRPLEDLRELSDTYRREVNLPFVIETNPKSVTTDKARLLERMNCVSATLGIETGDAALRRNLLKRVDTQEDIVRAFSALKAVGIRTSSFNMLGIPYETRRTYQSTVELNRKADVQYPIIGFFYPFEGTVLREVAIREGFFDPQGEEAHVYQRDRPALTLPAVSAQELIEMRNVFVLYVKLPRVYELFIRRSELPDERARLIRRALLEVYDKTVWANNGWYRDDGMQDEHLSRLAALMGDGAKVRA